MSALVAADLLKLRRRRGLWRTTLLLPAGIIVALYLLAATEAVDADGGQVFVRDSAAALAFIGPILAVLVGARLGSDEHAAGTLRYQLLTGVPRHRIYLSKLVVLAITCVALTAAGSLVTVILGAVLPAAPGGEGVGSGDVVDALWNVFLPSFAYGAIAFGVGALLRSTGPAIALALVLNLLGLDLLALLVLIDDWFRHLVLDVGIDRLTANAIEEQDRISIGAAIVLTIAWPAAFVFAGWTKLRTLEV